MKELGKLLKETRQAKNITLEEVSSATKINYKILAAIEEGDLEKLPARTFVRGFVQTYAKYLNINPQDILPKLQEYMGTTKAQSSITPSETEEQKRTDLNADVTSHARNIITFIAIVITIIAIVVIQKVVSKREADMKTTDVQAITGSDAPVTIKPAASPDGATTPDLSPTPTSSATPTVAAEAPSTPTPTPAPTPAPTPKPTPSPSPTAQPKPKATPTPAVKPIAKPTSAPTPVEESEAAAAPPVQAVPQELIVEALDSVVVKIGIDNKPAQEISMSSDQIQTFKAKFRIKLSTANGGAISIIHNGKEIGVPGNLGQPKSLSFPQ